MCPDKETLSAFIDNEVDANFRTIIKSHLESCSLCNKEAASITEVKSMFSENLSAEEINNARIRVWNNIESVIMTSTKPARPSIWQRKVAIPLPVMAAAVLIIVSTILSFYVVSYNKYEPAAQPNQLTFYETINFDSEDDFKLFESDEIFDIDLPEAASFKVSGTPKLIREVDYLNNNR